MLRLYKLVGEEPFVAEFIEEHGFDHIVKNPLIPRMRNFVSEGKPCVGLTWAPMVQFVEDILETMQSVKVPLSSVMWSSTPAGEVADSYKIAVATIESEVHKKIIDNNCVSPHPMSNKIN